MSLHEPPQSSVELENNRGIGGAGLWMGSGRLIGRVLDIIGLVTLARVLSPTDFGVVAMAMTVILLVEAATQIPLIQPILRAENPQPSHYDTAFTLGLIRAVVIGLVVVASAPLVAGYYGEPRLFYLLCFLALAPACRGLVSPRLADRVRVYDLRPDFVMVVGGKAVALAVIIFTVRTTGSYWAIAVGTVATPVIMCAVSYLFAPYRPRLGVKGWPDFVDIVGWNSVNQVVAALNYQIDRIILGRVASPAELGRFSLASDVSFLPIQAFVKPMNAPMVAMFARARERGEEDRLWLLSLNGLLMLFGPVFLGLAVLASPLVQLVLGPQWIEMAPLLTFLSLISSLALITGMLPPLAVALYRADLPAKRTMLSLLLRLPATAIGVVFGGVFGAVAGRAVGGAAESAFSFRAVKTLTGLGTRTQLWALRRTAAGLAAFGAATALLTPAISSAPTDLYQRAALLGRIGLAASSGVVAMGLLVLVLWLAEGRPPGLERRVHLALSRRLNERRQPDNEGI